MNTCSIGRKTEIGDEEYSEKLKEWDGFMGMQFGNNELPGSSNDKVVTRKPAGRGQKRKRALDDSHEDDTSPEADNADVPPPPPPEKTPQQLMFENIQKAARKLGTYQAQLLKQSLNIKATTASRPTLKQVKERHKLGEDMRTELAHMVAKA